MPSRLRFRRALPLVFALLAVFGLLGREVVPLAMPAQGAGNLGLLASLGAVICQGDPSAEHAPADPARHHAPDCALCPVCQLQAPGAQLLGPVPPVVLAVPMPRPAAGYMLAEARAPPSTIRHLAQPRGPPVPA